MSYSLIPSADYKAACDAIRAKSGKTDPIVSGAMAAEIEGLPSGGGLDINGVVEEYKVNAGANVNAGDFVEFVNVGGSSGTFAGTGAEFVKACKLDNSRVFVSYRDAEDSYYGKAVILVVGATEIYIGETLTFHANSISYPAPVALDDSRVLVAYRDSNNSNYGKAMVLTVDGTTISAKGDIVTFEAAATHFIAAALWADNTVVVAYQDDGNSDRGTAIVLTVDGTTITCGTPTVFANKISDNHSIAVLDSEKAILVCRANSMGTSAVNGYGGAACLLTRSGTTISSGALTLFSKGDISFCVNKCAVALGDSTALVVYKDDNSQYCTAKVLTASGTTIRVGAEYVFSNEIAYAYSFDVILLTSGKVLASFYDTNNSQVKMAKLIVVDTTITSHNSFAIRNMATNGYLSALAISETQAIICCGDGEFSNLLIDRNSITVGTGEGGTYVQPATSRDNNVGVAKTSGAEGEMVEVYCVGG